MQTRRRRVRSGSTYLYKRGGYESEVFDMRFKEEIDGEKLNEALAITAGRYPYLCTKFVWEDGDFYAVHNEAPMVARNTWELASLGGEECNHHLIDVTYLDSSLYISFHHGVCDGRGIKPFIETLIYYYGKLRYGIEDPPKGVYLAGEELLPGELTDPFLEKFDYDETKKFVPISRDAFPIPEYTIMDEPTWYRYEVKLPQDKFIAKCKEIGATPAIMISLIASHSIREIFPEHDKPINANLAVDMRNALGVPNTFMNCVRSATLPMSKEFAALSLEKQAAEWRAMLGRQRDRDFCRKEANGLLHLHDRLDLMKTLEERQKIMSFIEGMALNTYVVSYVGQFNFGAVAEHIADMHLYNSGTPGLGINAISCGDTFILDFKQSFPDDKYVRAFCKMMVKLNIPFVVSECIPFLTPNDSIMKKSCSRSVSPCRHSVEFSGSDSSEVSENSDSD